VSDRVHRPRGDARRGTTFAELLVAVALLAVTVPVLNRAWQVGRDLEGRAARDAEALALAEDRWALLRTGVLAAEPVADEALPGTGSDYRWSLAIEPTDFDGTDLGTVTVSYRWRGAERTLTLAGLLVTAETAE